jgi:nucleoid-associated protein YgaU
LPISRDVARNDNDEARGAARSVEYHPEALNVGAAPIRFAAARTPPATRTITIQPAPPPLPVTTPVRHVVAPGETLIAIARTRLGDEGRWRDIVAANPGLDASRIKAGQAIILPR